MIKCDAQGCQAELKIAEARPEDLENREKPANHLGLFRTDQYFNSYYFYKKFQTRLLFDSTLK
jgi:hypothetical protein